MLCSEQDPLEQFSGATRASLVDLTRILIATSRDFKLELHYCAARQRPGEDVKLQQTALIATFDASKGSSCSFHVQSPVLYSATCSLRCLRQRQLRQHVHTSPAALHQ
jgi:hypothetical protein